MAAICSEVTHIIAKTIHLNYSFVLVDSKSSTIPKKIAYFSIEGLSALRFAYSVAYPKIDSNCGYKSACRKSFVTVTYQQACLSNA